MPQGLPLPTSLFLGPQDFSEWERVGFFPGSSLSFWGCCRCFLSLAPSPSSLLGCRPSFLGVFHHILSSFSTISLRNSWDQQGKDEDGRDSHLFDELGFREAKHCASLSLYGVLERNHSGSLSPHNQMWAGEVGSVPLAVALVIPLCTNYALESRSKPETTDTTALDHTVLVGLYYGCVRDLSCFPMRRDDPHERDSIK